MLHQTMRFLTLPTLLILVGCATPPNLHDEKQALIRYHDSGRYEADVQHVASRAMQYIRHRAASGAPNLAVVLDIDDTATSTWGRLMQDDFARKDRMFVAWEESQSDPPIMPIRDLYRECRRLGVKVFFITARRTSLADRTRFTLTAAGYTDPDGIFFRPESDTARSLVPFKEATRRRLTEEGFAIIANIGDQYSDVAGGYAERSFKLPNPFYFTP
jgi:predicted secreted acid phosphatase